MNELYASLSPAVRDELSKYEEEILVPEGTTLISRSVAPEHVIVLQQGAVEISVPAGDKVLPLSIAHSGKVLGLRAIIAGALPEIEVRTVEECKILRIPKESFLEVLKQHPELYFAISKVLSADLNVAERFLRDIPRSAGKERVACRTG